MKMDTDEMKEVDPVNTREYGDRTYTDEYTYGKVFVAEVPIGFSQENVGFMRMSDSIRWEYKDKVPIVIEQDRVLCPEGANVEEAQNQAFFALSILSDNGYVSRWSKK